MLSKIIQMNESTNRRMEALERKMENTSKYKKWYVLLLNAVTISINHEVPNKEGQTSWLSWTALTLTFLFTLGAARFGWTSRDCLWIWLRVWVLLHLVLMVSARVLRRWRVLLYCEAIRVLNLTCWAFIGVMLLHFLCAVSESLPQIQTNQVDFLFFLLLLHFFLSPNHRMDF